MDPLYLTPVLYTDRTEVVVPVQMSWGPYMDTHMHKHTYGQLTLMHILTHIYVLMPTCVSTRMHTVKSVYYHQ